MLTQSPRSSHTALWIGLFMLLVGIGAGFLAGTAPLLPVMAIVVIGFLIYFFGNLEQAVLGMLVLRSALDIFSAQQLPAAFAMAIDVLTILYVAITLLSRRPVHTDGFWWFFFSWVSFQGLWVILLRLGALGYDASAFPDSLREWIRLFSWTMVYLLILQMRDRVPPKRFATALFLALLIPLFCGFLQMILPPHLLPPILAFDGGGAFEVGSRINGTLGHAATFSVFLLLFMALGCWKVVDARQRLPWAVLLAILMFFLVSTKALAGLLMFVVFTIALIAPRLSVGNLLKAIVFFSLVIALFASSEYGRERLASIYDTPLLNPDVDWSRSILMSWWDDNSFNWRVAQWTFLLDAWSKVPILGNGIMTCSYLSVLQNYAHNDYVRALTEEGMIGLSIFLGFIAVEFGRLIYLFRYSKNNSQRMYCSVLIAFLAARCVGMLTENIWSHTTMFFYWWSLVAIAGWNWEKYESSSDTQ